MSESTPVYLEAIGILSAALRRLAEGDYNPDRPGEAVFEIAARALGDVDHIQPEPEPAPGALAALREIESTTEWAIDNDDDSLSLEHIRDLARRGLKSQAEPQPASEGGINADIKSGAPSQPAPELSEAMRESRRYREALEKVRTIILEGGNGTEGSRLRRSRAVIRAALEGR